MIKINKIIYDSRFREEYRDLKEFNEISLKKDKSILYGPNGTGKTSFVEMFQAENKKAIEFEYGGKVYTSGEGIVHVINNQLSQNIIRGDDADFFIGDNITKEMHLRESIDSEIDELRACIKDHLKIKYSITTMKNILIDRIFKEDIREIIRSEIINKSSKKLTLDDGKCIVEALKGLTTSKTYIDDDDKKVLFIKNNAKEGGLLHKLLNINQIKKTEFVTKYLHSKLGLDFLEKYPVDDGVCFVCDSEFNYEEKLREKKSIKEEVYRKMDKESKVILEEIMYEIDTEDPFDIKSAIVKDLKSGQFKYLESVKKEINEYIGHISDEICSKIIDSLGNLPEDLKEYDEILSKAVMIEDEDLELLQKLIDEYMDKKLKIGRTEENHKIKIELDKNGLVNNPLLLSTGEKNFISLSFEFLRAKNRDEKIVIIDDPISSFDSIYKSKVVYLLCKILENKKTVILTHNLETVKLIESQIGNKFELYIFSNAYGEDEMNGFIPVSENEQELLTTLPAITRFLKEANSE